MRRPKTTDAIEILHDRYIGADAERAASLQEERVNAQVARTIRELREDARLTQKQLAELIGTTQSVDQPARRRRLRGPFALDVGPNRASTESTC